MGAHKEVRPALPMPIKAKPYRHQMEAFHFACDLFGTLPGSRRESGGCALLMEMGTGKSLTAVAITGALANAGRIRRVLVVAPLSILGVWEAEFSRFADLDRKSTRLNSSHP